MKSEKCVRTACVSGWVSFRGGQRSLHLGISALVTLSFAFAAFAQKETPPAGGPPKAFTFPKQDTYTLANGMQVTLAQYGSVPKVAMQTIVRAGTLNERADQRWISDMVASLLKEGTATRTAEQINGEASEMGGTIFTSAASDTTIVGGEVLSEFYTRFLALMADVVRNPTFAADDLERIRATRLREVAIARGEAGTQAWEKFREVIFPAHAYNSVYPSDEMLKSYKLADVKSFYYNQYGAVRTHLYVVGQFDSTAMKAAIEKAFGNWKKGPDPIRSVPKPIAKRSMTVIDLSNAPRSTIYLGMPAVSPSDPDFFRFTVVDALLGSSFRSRIRANLQDDKGFGFSTSFIWSRYNTGYWVLKADVQTEFTGASIKEILYEIDRLKKDPPTETELQEVKNRLINWYVLQNSGRPGIIGQLEDANYNEMPKDYLDTYVQNISAVTATDVSEMARKYLLGDKMTIVVVGDRSKINDQLKPYAK